uniref:C2H2-type domain-containing protein n=1 Tax=Strongyloides papillosus TaxID=174720 RepID=A0A0N5BFG2_STREA
MEKNIYINTPLCFVQSYHNSNRHKEAYDIMHYFPKNEIYEARELILSLVKDIQLVEDLNKENNNLYYLYNVMRTNFLKLKRQIPTFAIANIYSIPKALLSGIDISSNTSTIPVSSYNNKDDISGNDEDNLFQNPSPSTEGFLALTPPLSSSDRSSPKEENEYKNSEEEDLLKSFGLKSNSMDCSNIFSILSLLQNNIIENNIMNVDNLKNENFSEFPKEFKTMIPSNNDFNNIDQQYRISLLQSILTNITFNQQKNPNLLSNFIPSNNININNISRHNELFENDFAKILPQQRASRNEENTIASYLLSSKKIDDKPFKCDFESCLKTFSNKHLLKKHQFTHTGIRPHGCTYCGKKFSRKDNCLRHERSHGNDISKVL